MANPEHLAKLKKGVKAWNRWREENGEIRPDLSGAFLTEANLRGADLDKTKLRRADLRGASLGTVVIHGVDKVEGPFVRKTHKRAHLHRADLHEAKLGGADLQGADLEEAYLISADLREADLSGARVAFTTFANVDLSEVKGLEAVRHLGPSSIGIDTIYKSKGKIPHVFLRGCGVPENFIEYMASLVGSGIEFYSLFISYSTKDQEFADRLYADLQAKGVRCWFAPHDIQGGKKLHEQIDEAIRVYDKLLLILSPDSMASEWVKTEISKARKREIKEATRILFPIRLCSFETLRDWECFDADAGKDSAREIREYFIPDFSNWKDHDAYKLAFDRLLKDLHGAPSAPALKAPLA